MTSSAYREGAGRAPSAAEDSSGVALGRPWKLAGESPSTILWFATDFSRCSNAALPYAWSTRAARLKRRWRNF